MFKDHTVTVLLSLLSFCAPAEQLIDLSYSYDKQTLYWPTAPTKFEFNRHHHGYTEDGLFYSYASFSTAEHGGTHMDAPIHFNPQGLSVDEIPVEKLRLPGVVIDIAAHTAKDRHYRLSVADVLAFEKQHGKIKPNTAVLVHTGWSQYWPDAKAYLGDDTPGDASKLSFPGFGAEAARLLSEQRKVGMLGIDTASTDYGQSQDFIVHQIIARQNVPALENLTNVDKLPATGFTLIALPMKISGGSGSPARVIAIVDD